MASKRQWYMPHRKGDTIISRRYGLPMASKLCIICSGPTYLNPAYIHWRSRWGKVRKCAGKGCSVFALRTKR